MQYSTIAYHHLLIFEFKSREIASIHNILSSCAILLNVCREHSSNIAMLFVETIKRFQMYVMDEWYFASFLFDIGGYLILQQPQASKDEISHTIYVNKKE